MQVKNFMHFIKLFVILIGSGIILIACGTTGSAPSETVRLSFAKSPQWSGDRFRNRLPKKRTPLTQAVRQYFLGKSDYRDPKSAIQINRLGKEDFQTLPETGLRVIWLGHSTVLVEIDGKRILIDPVWSDSVSPIPWLGGKRYHEPPIALADLPPIDAVVISHDHYDHLDMPTVKQLSEHSLTWIVPLGVGSHLTFWGVDPKHIVERDWWQSHALGNVTVTATPARHTSGRSFYFSDVKTTLWAGWTLKGPQHAVFYSGDTSLHNEFKDIGERLGPFNITIIETGGYDPLWPDSHLGPEQAVIAHQLVKGNILLPVHWGTFPVAPHGWTEPGERVLAAAKKQKVSVALPIPGASITLYQPLPSRKWWPELPWDSAEKKPIWSTMVSHSITELQPKVASYIN